MDALDGPITQEEIASAIGHPKDNKIAGHRWHTRRDAEELASPDFIVSIVVLFNRIFDSGEYPTTWTDAIIVPIHESGDRNNSDNYRGVSLLSIL